MTEASGSGREAANTLSVQAAWFDYDNDGLLDLVVCELHRMDAGKRPPLPAWGRGGVLQPSDLRQRRRNGSITTWGKGKFEDVTERSGFGAVPGKGMGIGIADFNDDGWMDVFIANDTEPNFLFINQKNGTFKEAGPAVRSRIQRERLRRFFHGRRCQRLRQRRRGGYLLQRPDGSDLGAVS